MQTLQQLQQRLNQVQDRLESEAFLTNKELGGEIGFYIFDYAPEHELAVREHLAQLAKKLESRSEFTGKRFANINLFEMVIEFLKHQSLLQDAYEMHMSDGDDALFEALEGPLDHNLFADFIVDKHEVNTCDFILITGLGSAWPVIRGHGLLNALHAKVGNKPTVMFYPGEYDGAALKPFGRIESNNYYRAFKLVS
ncbi:DUF1788 domain-containing protein [Oceanisphaera ostreae]|uniref:DUF1788 domain-containing protein n=1 Tax=Oceanisphaera ostreae TaxID=914151 RepID=A0ABW3KG45_9GAMM